MSVLEILTFDGFYAFLAEARGARRVVAVDNEQYREWVSSRWGVELEGGEGFAAIRELLHSEVDYRRLDAFDLDELGEFFRSTSLRYPGPGEQPAGAAEDHSATPRCRRMGTARDPRVGGSVPRFLGGGSHPRGGRGHATYFVYWGFTPAGFYAMAHHAGFEGFELIDAPLIDGHPRVLGALRVRPAPLIADPRGRAPAQYRAAPGLSPRP